MRNTKIKNRALVAICCIIAVITIFAAGNFLLLPKAYAETSEGNVSNLTESQYEITNTDNPNGVRLSGYPTNNYAKKASLSWGVRKEISVTGSDDIVKIIPEHLFKSVGVTQHIGKNYGFFIETRKPLENCDMLLSTVMIIDIHNTDDMFSTDSKSHLKIKVEPIFQADFAYVQRGDERTYSLADQGYSFFRDNYYYDLYIQYPAAGNEFVIPVPTLYYEYTVPKIGFFQHNKHYLTDLSNQTSLYNVNHLNSADPGYIVYQDMGCFFSQLDFSYDGVFLENGKTTAEDVGSVIYDATSFAFDIYDGISGLKSVFKAVPVIGSIITTADIISSIANIRSDLKDRVVSESKTLSYQPLYNNKDQQIAESGGLRKDAAIAIKSEGAKRLLFGTNDTATFDYQIHCQDIRVDTRYATMINFGVMPVLSINTRTTEFGNIHWTTGVYSNELKNHTDESYKEIPEFKIGGLKSDANLQILPNCQGMMQLSPAFSGEYNVVLDNPYSGFSVYEVSKLSNGILNYKDLSTRICISNQSGGAARGSEIYLDSAKNYLLIADMQNNSGNDGIYGRYGILNLSAELEKKNLALGENSYAVKLDQEYFKFDSAINVNYKFAINDANSVLNLLNADFEVVKSSENGILVATFAKGETYYLRLDRGQSASENVLISVSYEMYVQFDNIQGITEPIDETITVVNGQSVTLPIPHKIGYTFDGWWTRLDNLGERVTDSNIFDYICPELTLSAKWTPIQYTISYEENGGVEIPNDDYIIEHDVILNQNVTRSGYVFCGWYDNAAFNGDEIKRISAGSFGDKTFYARWVKDTFNVTMNVNAGYTDGVAAALEVSSKAVSFRQAFTLPIPVLGGFIFEGWYKDSMKYTDNAGNSLNAYADECDISLTAKWSREKYFIKVNANGTFRWLTKNGDGFGFSADKSYVENEIGLCPNCYIESAIAKGGPLAEQMKQYLSKEGHRYRYMITDVNDPSSLACWQGAQLGIDFNDNDVIEVFAYYEKEQQFKIYLENGNGGYTDILYADYDEQLQFNKLPEKDGYTFSHFVVSAQEAKNNVYIGTHLAPGNRFDYDKMPDLSIGIERDGDAIYLAPVFTPNQYTVSFSNIVQSLPQKIVTFDAPYNTSNENAFPVPAKTGYSFKGWYTGPNGTGEQKTDELGNMNRWDIDYDCELYAKWVPFSYFLTFDKQGGIGGIILVLATYESPMPTIAVPTKEGYDFGGYYAEANGAGQKYYNSDGSSAHNWNNAYNATLFASWTPKHYTVTLDMNDGSGVLIQIDVVYGQLMPKFMEHSPYKKGYSFLGAFAERDGNGEKYYYSWGTEYVSEEKTELEILLTDYVWYETSDRTIYAFWSPLSALIPVTGYCSDGGCDLSFEIYYAVTTGQTFTLTAPEKEGHEFKSWLVLEYDPSRPEHGGLGLETFVTENKTVTVQMTVYFGGGDETVARWQFLGEYIKSACVAEGSQITLADGSQKAVENLTGDEELLVWNLFTGSFDTAPILFIDHDARREYEVINLGFSDGTSVKVISEHGFWDLDLNEYVFLRNDAAKYIGHWFYKQTTDGNGKMSWTRVRLESVKITTEVTTAWSPVTYGHLCYYVNGMLSMPGATTGLINIFDVDPDTMKIDEAAYTSDIEKYGLFTYEEFAESYPVPEAIFEAFGAQYFKVAIGKGILTGEMLTDLIERYSKFFNTEEPLDNALDLESDKDKGNNGNQYGKQNGNNGNHYGHDKHSRGRK